ncbi:hypothetical protein EV424DRAFT_1542184 [Suillus variegatus]|nr:hypothetical protein EV424DRAFT_1542184 [Suillus variegatus]
MYCIVVGALQKKELLKKIQDDTGVNPGKLEMMKYYSEYLTDMVNALTEKEVEDATIMAGQWNKQGVPPDVQADAARRKSKDLLQYVASEMFKKAGMRLFILLAWKDEDGKLIVSSHDYNEEIRNGGSFERTHDWKNIMPEWKSYVSKEFDKEVKSDVIVKKGQKAYILQMVDDAFPLLQDHTEMDLETWKAVV